MDDRKEKIIQASIEMFDEKGEKFTMNDVALKLGMSKKTIYKLFESKEAVLCCMIDYYFDKIGILKLDILDNDELSITDKLVNIIEILTNGYKNVNFIKWSILKSKYPQIYKSVEERFEIIWEEFCSLIEMGMKNGEFRQVNILILKIMIKSTLEKFSARENLFTNNISYDEAINEMVNILNFGIKAD